MIPVRQSRQALDVHTQQLGEDLGLGITELGKLRGHVLDGAVSLTQLNAVQRRGEIVAAHGSGRRGIPLLVERLDESFSPVLDAAVPRITRAGGDRTGPDQLGGAAAREQVAERGSRAAGRAWPRPVKTQALAGRPGRRRPGAGAWASISPSAARFSTCRRTAVSVSPR